MLAHAMIGRMYNKIITARNFRVSALVICSANMVSVAELQCSRFKCQSPPDIGDFQEFGGYV
jgi:hypothetical protein